MIPKKEYFETRAKGPCKHCVNWYECWEPCNIYWEWVEAENDIRNGNGTKKIRS